jgi:hypothetical protein
VVCRHVSNKLGCAAGERRLRNTVLDSRQCVNKRECSSAICKSASVGRCVSAVSVSNVCATIRCPNFN